MDVDAVSKRKDLKQSFALIKELEKAKLKCKYELKDAVCIKSDGSKKELIEKIAKSLIPWRKGPFLIDELFIDSEWQSFIKFDLLKPYLKDIKGKDVADIGCNNAYYSFKMLEFEPKSLVGFDPSPKFYLQYRFINALLQSAIKYELLGVQDLLSYELKFDYLFALGILYHRKDPLQTLKELRFALKKDGILILDTLYIEAKGEIALIPRKTYAKMSNIYYIPSILALRNWCERAGFKDFEVLAKNKTTLNEQRKSPWINSHSLEEFLSKDMEHTIEGYDAPRRVYIKVRN